jgi:Na+-driven multidrug efflux pump
VSLSMRNITSLGVIIYGTSQVAGFGATTLAAHEILRQAWVFLIQAFTAFDIAAQSLVASYLGRVRMRAGRGHANPKP